MKSWRYWLAILLVCVSFSVQVTSVSAAWIDAVPYADDDDNDDQSFWEKLMDSLSISNILDTIFSYFEERDEKLDALFINSNFTEEEQQQISAYSGGKSPAELTSEFCSSSKTTDAQMIMDDIRRSYQGTEADPQSPIHLIELFERMSSFCP